MLRGRKSSKYKDKILFARKLRKNPTFFEEILWKELRCKKLSGFKFRRQALILGWIVDFYCPKTKLIVELDGRLHNKVADDKRDKAMNKLGLTVLRFKNEELLINKSKVLEKILSACGY